MGIYISGVKGLPEQVQENKNKIKEVEEQIEGIDFEAVRQLQGQVAENTQDINNLEASIGVQNQAINGLDQRLTTAEGTITNQGDAITTLENNVGALQTKTQSMSYDDYFGFTSLNDGFVSVAGANTLLFTDAGLKLNGQDVGKTYYWHNIRTDNGSYVLNILTTRSTAFTLEDLALYLYTKGIRQGGRYSPIYMEYLTRSSGSNSYYLGVFSDDGITVKSNRESGTETTITSIVVDNVYEA